MKDLKCGKKSCKHNKGYCCCAKQVQVDKDADCLTFCPDDGMSEFAQDGGKANYSVDRKRPRRKFSAVKRSKRPQL